MPDLGPVQSAASSGAFIPAHLTCLIIPLSFLLSFLHRHHLISLSLLLGVRSYRPSSSVFTAPLLPVADGLRELLSRANAEMRSAVDAAKRETALHRPAGDLGDAARDAIGSSIASSSSPSSQPQSQQGDTESERLLTEISRLRRHIAALEDTTDGSVERHQSELLALTTELQAEIDRLAHDNTALRRRLVLDTVPGGDPSRVKSVAELYSDILTLRADADAAFKGEDHLPRVVVVGDQSAGKTSVLEMIARARIFPRGAGEMMTRAPVQVRRSSPTRQGFSRFYFPSDTNRAHQLLWHPLLCPQRASLIFLHWMPALFQAEKELDPSVNVRSLTC
jgi:hypothetical protein